MKRWMRLAATLYPRIWRERFGEEFDALLDDCRPSGRELLDVAKGAVCMQIAMGRGYLKFIGALAICGFLAASSISFLAPRKYVSSAEFRTRDADQLRQVLQSRAESLAHYGSILDLYPERDRLPKAERDRLTKVELLNADLDVRVRKGTRRPDGSSDSVIQVSFAHTDKAMARALIQNLSSTAVSFNEQYNSGFKRNWKRLWPNDAPPERELAEVISPATEATRAPRPSWLLFGAIGCGVGLIVGVLLAFAKRRPRDAGWVFGFAAAGAALALIVSAALPVRYVSTAVLKVVPPVLGERESGAWLLSTMDQRYRKCLEELSSTPNLWLIVQEVGLYGRARTSRPLARILKPFDQILETMRKRDLAVRPVASAGPPTFSISFTYSDRYKAQKVVERLISVVVDAYLSQQHQSLRAALPDPEVKTIVESGMGDRISLLSRASLPSYPVSPNPKVLGVAGAATGLVCGIVALRIRRRRGAKLLIAG
jgi:capsular polysaccharide biosynthesis protein